MKKLKIAYFGSPDFSARFLEKLLTDKTTPVDVVQVVTQPDKPAGRKNILTASAVKTTAEKHKIPVFQLIDQLKHDVDLALVFAYGEMIPKKILDIPKYSFWNVHPSLLPLYRGPSPVAQPLIDGAKKTGVTLIKMNHKMDHGPIIAQQETEIGPKERRPELTLRLTDLAFDLFKKTIRNIGDDMFLQEQQHDHATYTKLFAKSDGFIRNLEVEIRNSPKVLFNRFRGLYPWPGIWTLLRQGSGGQAKRLKITDMDFVNGKIEIKRVQLEGKKEVDYNTFCKAYNLELY